METTPESSKNHINASRLLHLVSDMEGQSGVNQIGIALKELIDSFENGFDLPLDCKEHQQSFLEDMDVMISELIMFRQLCKYSLLHNSALPDELPNAQHSELSKKVLSALDNDCISLK